MLAASPGERHEPLPATEINWMQASGKRSPGSLYLKEGFSCIAGDDFAGGVAQADDFVPIVTGGRIGRDERAESNCDAAGAREARLIAQDLARAANRNGTNRPLHIHRSFERAELKGSNSGERGESSFGIHRHGFSAPQRFLYIFGLTDARLRIAAIESELPGAANKFSDQGHLERIAFGDEADARGKSGERDKNIDVARMIRRKKPGPRIFQAVQNFRALDFYGNRRDEKNQARAVARNSRGAFAVGGK